MSAQDAQAIVDALAQHCGSDVRYRHALTGLVYTPGIADMCARCAAYWLLDKVTTCQQLAIAGQRCSSIATERFQVWTLDVRGNPAQWATLTATDGNDRKLHSERIDYTDFPLSSIAVWVVDGVIMLPSEY